MGVEPFELHAGIVCCELPFGFGVVFVELVLPSDDLLFESLLVRNTAVQTFA